MELQDNDMETTDNKSNGSEGHHRSFLHHHHDSYSGLLQRDLQLPHHKFNSSGSTDLHHNNIRNGGVRLNSVRHRREDSDDIRSDSSSDHDHHSDHQSDHGDNTGGLSVDPKTRVYQIGVSDLTELLASTNNVLQRNSNLRASLTI